MPMTPAIPAKQTTISRREFAVSLIKAWRSDQGQIPTKAQVAVLYAQYGIETGAGRYCWNFNFGNVKCTQAQAEAGTPYTMLRGVWEIIGGQRVTFEPPHPATWFRAFTDADDGMHFYLGLLRRRFSAAWLGVLAGDPADFARRLKAANYYTAPVEEYVRGMRAHFDVFSKTSDYEDAIEALNAVPTEPADEMAETEPQPVIRPDVPHIRYDGLPLDPKDDDDAQG